MMQLLKISEHIVVSTMSSPYMAGYSRRYAREAFLVGRGTVGGGLSVSKLKHTSIQDANSNELLVCNATSDMDSDYQRLHFTMRELAHKRQKGTSIRKKTVWALYEKKRFEGMIEDVTGFINRLVILFPATQDEQRALCTTEVSAINQSQDLALLNNVAREDDQMFSAEITKELEKRGHNVTDWKADGSSKMWIGDKNAFGVNSKGHNAARFTVSDHADIHVGNMNEGR